MTLDASQPSSSSGKKKFPKMDQSSNEHIKKFKKSKGAEYVTAVKKRKSDANDSGAPTSPKKPRFSVPNQRTNFNKTGTNQPGGNFKGNQKFEKPDWNKMKKETKERKKERKKRHVGGDESYDSFTKAVKLWEELRHSNCSKERRLQLCREVAQLFGGVVKVWIKQASGVRMAEHLVAYGDADVRRLLFDEINTKAQILDIMKDSHSQHFLQKILRHGSKEQRQAIIDATEGQIVKLTKHAIASQVIELAYGEFATAPQRATMMQEFFGPHFVYFKEEGIKSLADVLKKYPNKKEAVMKDLQKGLQAIMHKGIFNNALILSLLKEYLMFCEPAERNTVIESLEDGLLPVVHTRDGARIAMMCLWHGTAKQRKTILKSFKEHLLEVATWDHSYMVLLAAMDCVDDTKFLGKAVLDTLMKQKDKLFESEIGTRVFRYMALGRNPTYFHPDVLNVLKLGDGNTSSKKDAAVRRQEIVAHISPGLLESILRNVEFWSRNVQWTLFLGPAIAALPTAVQKRTALEAVAKHCGEVMPAEVNSLMDLSHSAKMINFLVLKDADNKKNKMPLFSLLLLKHARQNIVKWLNCNRGCFLAVRLLETGIGRVVVATRDLVADHIHKIKKIKETAKGAQILLEKLEKTETVEESDEEEEEDEKQEEEEEKEEEEEEQVVEENEEEREDDENGDEEGEEDDAEQDTSQEEEDADSSADDSDE